ncbi:hypothetical protein O2N63_01845 [Aliiroseovarius sp. KMU-50]|uniref:Magnesium transporter MgtE intracellular domain-containing protein n=1 Tax=Aliiroseovarius salicola TaxID=3009082 RepID=A0ABT4VX36_9RHOB|nr:hypothetical protein [Aliiroseovarius sp. KMU-50]MDA5092825.1 hypothetical protein [Aliiroseovarius sp. KMU-50]
MSLKRQSAPPSPQKPKRTKAGGRGALWVVTMLFLASGVVRFGDYGVAIAKEVSAAASVSAGHSTAQDVCETEEDIAEVLHLLRGREQDLKQRESDLSDRLAALALAEAEISKNMTALTEAEDSLKATMALAKGASENDLAQLTQVYENMKSKQAVPLFAQMDPQFAAGFLGRMRSEAAAQIMAGLDPAHAYAISVILAGRNSNVPTN